MQDASEIALNKLVDHELRFVVQSLSKGSTVEEAAKEISENTRTLEGKLSRLRKLFNCANNTELVAFFLRNKLIK